MGDTGNDDEVGEGVVASDDGEFDGFELLDKTLPLISGYVSHSATPGTPFFFAA